MLTNYIWLIVLNCQQLNFAKVRMQRRGLISNVGLWPRPFWINIFKVRFWGGGGGHTKEYAVYARENDDNYGRTLKRRPFFCCISRNINTNLHFCTLQDTQSRLYKKYISVIINPCGKSIQHRFSVRHCFKEWSCLETSLETATGVLKCPHIYTNLA